jgi:sterol desaturase/sphingolipid hydroxylase (fatty acid hydroxylase superfamily)
MGGMASEQSGKTAVRNAEIRLRLGEGLLSGYGSALLGLASLGGVLCFAYPSLLTTGDLRDVYDPIVLRQVLYVAVVLATVLGAVNFLFAGGRTQALIGLLAASSATVLGGPFVETSGANAGELALGLDYFILTLLVSALIFIPIEKLAPAKRGQPILRSQWRTDLEYFAASHLLVSYILLVSLNFAPVLFGWAPLDKLQATVAALALPIQFMLAVFVADLTQYWLHRFYHRNRWFWGLHAVHHSAPAMDWLAGSRQHLIEIVITRSVVFAPIFLLGFSLDAVAAYVVFVGLQAVFAHANFGVNLGPLSYLLVTPQYHHWHHAEDPEAVDTNFAVHLPVIDMMFGTFRFPRDRWPERYGVIGESVPETMRGQLLYPFRRGSARS